MKRMVLLAFIALGAVGLQSCDKDDDKNVQVPDTLRQAFTSRYPNVAYAEWERKGDFYEAEFSENGYENSAWFLPDGTWLMTERDLRYEDLPQNVRQAFESGEYAGWRRDDIDVIEQKDMETKYIIEVEMQNQEYDLIYFEDGTLVSAQADSGNSDEGRMPMAPQQASDIKEEIEKRYPGARILDIEYENRGRVEVEIRDGSIQKEVVFTSDNAGSYAWVQTSCDVRWKDIPKAVADTIENNRKGAEIDNVDFIETPSGNYYLVELEMHSADIYLKIDEQGTVLNA